MEFCWGLGFTLGVGVGCWHGLLWAFVLGKMVVTTYRRVVWYSGKDFVSGRCVSGVHVLSREVFELY